MNSKKTAQFSITEENYWRLKELASAERKTLSVFLRDVVQSYINNKGIEINLADSIGDWGGQRDKNEEGG
jgi:predicted DNA-binding protein